MKKSLLTLIALFVTFSMFAVPAHPRKHTATQPDGSTIEYRLIGDEIYHYTLSMNGKLLEKDAKGFLVETGEAPTDEQVKARRAVSPRKRAVQPRRVGDSSFADRGLVILVEFSDTKFQKENPKSAFEELLNGDNYTYNGATGSVKKYYQDQSDNAFSPTFDVYGPVSVSKTAAWYGSNDYRVGNMIAEALDSLFKKYDIDITLYDSDNDKNVDFVDVLYAGYGAADSDYETVWPCEWSLSDSGQSPKVYKGDTINTFSCHQERDGYTGKRAGIGTPCHEFGHVFGLPDFYDTNYKNATLGNWDLMDGGAYNNNSNTPPGFSGYERMFAGWAHPRLINSPENVTLQELQSSQEVLVVSATGNHNLDATDPNPTTFYLLENRQQTGWDKYIPGHGMLIWKIQYSAYKWMYNTVNNASVAKQGVAIMAADGKVYSETYNGDVYTYGDSGDPYPGTSTVTEYKTITNYPITDITESAGLIRFKFMGGASVAYTVSFDAGLHGSCSTTSLTETEPGKGIVLPAVIADENYIFIGWSTTQNSLNADAGKTGNTYKPTSNLTLYAVYSPAVCNITWTVEHASVNPQPTTINGTETLTATVQAEEGYIVDTRDINVSIGGQAATSGNGFSFVSGILTIPDVRSDLSISIIAREKGAILPCDNYAFTFTENPVLGENILNDYTWDISMESGTLQLFESTRGAHFGSKGTPPRKVSLKSDDTETCSIESVVVNASRTATQSTGIPVIAVTIGGTAIGEMQTLTQNPTDFTFENSAGATGEIEIVLTSTNAGVYVKSINIKYSDSIPSAVTEIATKSLPYSLNGRMLTINADGDMTIYNATGMMLSNRYIQGLTEIILPQGFYLLQLNTAESQDTYKIFIP